MSSEPPSPQNLLAQMELMLAALSADLVQLDAELQPSAAPADEEEREGGVFTPEADRA
ncbi:hypothetical protein [Streptacidiphilus neutrinimicus]|uniref:hypothetical protein n=1 Tax=Streptacidiphilus neutrinimicus TaxID=105420 RepID=UPI000AE903A6|nr:hypothetical protein [Streptacidiphilus neutrinimicus]